MPGLQNLQTTHRLRDQRVSVTNRRIHSGVYPAVAVATISPSHLSTNKPWVISLFGVDEADSPKNPTPARFEATRWSIVLASAQTQAPGAKEALAELCRTYWQPLYAYARRHRGLDHHQAQDAIQNFFLNLIETKWFANADPLRGKFRSYLLVALKHHMASEGVRDRALKRGGGAMVLSIDEANVEQKFDAAHIANQAPAEDVFEREWAVAAVEAAMLNLEGDFVRRKKRDVFLALKPYLVGEQTPGTYEETARKLRQTVGALRTGVHRLRQDFRTHLRREIAKTVDSPDQIDEEMRHLRTVLGGGSA